jgi:hypothetical protein
MFWDDTQRRSIDSYRRSGTNRKFHFRALPNWDLKIRKDITQLKEQFLLFGAKLSIRCKLKTLIHGINYWFLY